MSDFQITVIGAGVVGLATAFGLSQHFNDILVIDKEQTFGTETSSRNSEVIHAGIYYPEDSLKAKLCVEGRKLLYDFCDRYNIPYKKTGKLIVASYNEKDHLIDLYKRGVINGAEGLELIEKEKIKELEPNVKGDFAIYSKETGILDTHSYMRKLYLLNKDKGVLFGFSKKVSKINKLKSGYLIEAEDGERIQTKYVVNSAGLYSDKLAEMVGIDIDKAGYRIRYCKGDYFYYSRPAIVSRLVYPLPHDNLKGLGVHITLDLAGRMKFGPSAYFVDAIDYSVDVSKRDYFFESALKLLEGVNKDFIHPDMAGIRPKLKGEGVRDFVINEESQKGFEGFVNLIGIESPGLTASLAIGQYVSDILRGLRN
ncbi:MAG: NAD(P)/FAD-dependent oxidoreductase [Proteobacteria bacterium]|nr:NAD(P)/FAD-dependent oxidoreductase [Pseudomonadota bacterium]